mgnify:CR=1 FL=1
MFATRRTSGIMIICHSDEQHDLRRDPNANLPCVQGRGRDAKRSFDFAQDDKLVARKRRGAQVGDNGGLLGPADRLARSGHAANEMWPLIARIFCHWRQGVAFESSARRKVCVHSAIARAST